MGADIDHDSARSDRRSSTAWRSASGRRDSPRVRPLSASARSSGRSSCRKVNPDRRRVWKRGRSAALHDRYSVVRRRRQCRRPIAHDCAASTCGLSAVVAAICAGCSALPRLSARGRTTRRHGTTARASAVRLIAGASAGTAATALRAGVEIRLAPGWKTYWRYPGDSGVPPRFDFAKSEMSKSVTVSVAGAASASRRRAAASIGYSGDVMLPLQDRAEGCRPSRSMLRLKLDYAICEKLCVPVEARSRTHHQGRRHRELSASPRPSSTVPRARRSRRERRARDQARPPRRRRQAARVLSMLRPRQACRRLVRRRPDAGLGAAGAPTGRRRTRGLQRFAFELDGLPPGADARGRRPSSSPRSPAATRSKPPSGSTNRRRTGLFRRAACCALRRAGP